MRFHELLEETDINVNELKFVVPRWYNNALERGEFEVIEVDVQKFDREWSKTSAYIEGPESKNIFRTRYKDFGEWLKKGEAIVMSIATIDAHNEAYFSNGHHRFAWLRDHGLKKVPMLVYTDKIDEFKRRYT